MLACCGARPLSRVCMHLQLYAHISIGSLYVTHVLLHPHAHAMRIDISICTLCVLSTPFNTRMNTLHDRSVILYMLSLTRQFYLILSLSLSLSLSFTHPCMRVTGTFARSECFTWASLATTHYGQHPRRGGPPRECGQARTCKRTTPCRKSDL